MSTELKDKKELKRIQLVKNKIMKDHPFFAPGLEALPIIIDRRVPTACTDGNVIRINPDYTETQNMYELEGLLIHEVCHPLFGHFVRFFEPMQNGEGSLVNKATDVEINNLLTEYSSEAARPIVLPSGGYVDLDRFGTEAAEHVLKVLREEEQESPDTPPDNPGDDEGESGGDSTGDSEGDGSSEPEDQDGEQGESESTSGSSPGDGQSEGTGGGAGQEPVSPVSSSYLKGQPKRSYGIRKRSGKTSYLRPSMLPSCVVIHPASSWRDWRSYRSLPSVCRIFFRSMRTSSAWMKARPDLIADTWPIGEWVSLAWRMRG